MSFPSVSGLSDRELLSRVKVLVQKERATTLEILVHLNEVERRRLYLSLGYPSLFEYCTRHLGYSSSAAGRRIHAARCVRNFPEVYGLLKKNEVNVSTVSLVASILTEGSKDDLLSRIRGKSQKQVEGIVADYRPPVSFRDRARPVCVAVPELRVKEGGPFRTSLSDYSRSGSEISPNAVANPGAGLGGCDASRGGVAGGCVGARDEAKGCVAPGRDARETPGVCGPPPTPAHAFGVRLERKLLVQFLASEAFMKKFERAQALLSNRLGAASYEAVLETVLDEFLDRHSPEEKKQRREKRKRRVASARRPRPRATKLERSRRIPAAIRDEVLARDNGRCTYKGTSGKRCDSTLHLQIDHIVPFARGGTNVASNLRLLCARHNQQEAERVYGANAIRGPHPRE